MVRFQKTRCFSSAPSIPEPTNFTSIVNNIQSSEEPKMSSPFSNNINSFNTAVNVWNRCTVADERSQILTWLSPLEPKLRHQDIQDRRVESIGEWLLQTEEFRSWYTGSEGSGSDDPVLFCHGDPGVGKTYIR